MDRASIEGLHSFHGHRCPASLQGLRAGYYAMQLLDVEKAKDHELQAVIETGEHHFGGCFGDGIQYSTGVTFGKGNISKNPLGKFAFTLIDPSAAKAVRVALKAEVLKDFLKTDFFNKRKNGVPAYELPKEDVNFVIDNVINATDEELFTYNLIEDYPIAKHQSTFEALECHGCKEMVVSSYVLSIGQENYCKTCGNKILFG